MARKSGGLSGRQKTWLWVVIATAVVIALLYWEQIALLYVLGTLAVTWLLVVVALADLHDARRSPAPLEIGDDAAALGSNITDAPPAPRTTPRATFGARTGKKRR
ncbi:MAG: hypothetical protein JOZ52_03995 [Acidobacteria bacterium]|nr:hypothetical protein [Acidobacteriota bacterium]